MQNAILNPTPSKLIYALPAFLILPQPSKNSEGNKTLQALYGKILFVCKAISEAMLVL